MAINKSLGFGIGGVLNVNAGYWVERESWRHEKESAAANLIIKDTRSLKFVSS